MTNSVSRKSQRFSFPKRMRLVRQEQFLSVYQANVRANTGQLLIYAKPNNSSSSRLGLAVPQRVGTAVVRNTIKRRLREAFRLNHKHWPCCYDVVVKVNSRNPLSLNDYEKIIHKTLRKLHATWMKKKEHSKTAE